MLMISMRIGMETTTCRRVSNRFLATIKKKASNEEGRPEIVENPKIDLPLNKNEILEKLDSVAAETEAIKISHNRKFEQIAEKLRSIEESVSKIPKFEEKPKSAKEFVLKHVFNKVVEFEEDDVHLSENECHFKANWYINVTRLNNHLGFYVRCEPVVPKDKWSIQTKIEFKVVGRNHNDVIKTMDHCYETITAWGFDVVLVAKDREFYLSKYFLGLQSSYFKGLFLGKFEESQKDKIELKDIDPDDFQNFLELTHGESSVDDDTVSGILRLSDMYDAPTAIRRCEEFLLKNSHLKVFLKINNIF
ncbi:hypothetical protein L3Y34_019572 [Caenorhabditis briggsae]|uniref:BTB domain-containing protein n=1 Tax=Caenorhabditis briggsae TaxID=6238 RepID=A0AAE9DNI0_CAEBR|nr:hypothetical protein L3Y34_019572 [Caenorhabditis briggsae]